jgi:hypothetical protein
MAETAGTDVAPVDKKRVAQLELVHQAILGNAELPVQDPEAMSRAIMERILQSTSFEDVFTQQSLTPWRAMLGVPFFVKDVHFNRSGFEGQNVYAVCDLDPAAGGDQVTVTCGGQNVLAQLVVMLKNGWQDRPVRMIENKTAEGYGALWLEAA